MKQMITLFNFLRKQLKRLSLKLGMLRKRDKQRLLLIEDYENHLA